MVQRSLKISILALGLLGAVSASAYADCEADLVQLEAAMKAPGHTAEQLVLMKAAGEKAAEALRKDDDKTCNQIVMDTLKATGPKVMSSSESVPSSASIGDLKPMRAIADDTLKLVQKGDLAGGKARIKDLEVAWDKARNEMRGKNPGTWEELDKLIDTALKQLRADKPDAKGSIEALSALLSQIDKTK